MRLEPGPELLFLMAILLGGCHSDAFRVDDPGGDAPLEPGDPTRLTYNPGTDRGARWLPDGTGIVYSLETRGNPTSDAPPDSDRCLGVLPPTGGQLLSERCERADGSDTTTDAWEWPSVGPGGALAWMVSTSRVQALTFQERFLRLEASGPAEDILIFPYTASGRQILDARDIRWLSPDSLVYVAQAVWYVSPCPPCPPDTLDSGLEVVLVTLDGTPARNTIPGTDLASSVAPGPTSDEIYFTLNNDPRVYHLTLSSGAITVVHDFGAGGIARGIDVVGNRLVAVVGGPVNFQVDPLLGPVQRDDGGNLYLVDLSSGNETVLTQHGRCWRHPSLSPDGTRAVAEGYVALNQDCDPFATPFGPGDLWLFDLP